MLISWGEFFPGFDGKDSKVVGLMEAAIPPKADQLRSPADAGFGEIPNIGHQGGSAICAVEVLEEPGRRLDLHAVGLLARTS